MEIVKETDLPDLLEHLGYQVRRLGSRYHTTREMDSIRIKDRRTWKRYSNGTGGDAITFLQEFCGKDFREAVNYLLEFNGHRARDSPTPRPRPVRQEEKPAFALPIPHADQRRVFAYLQKRGIAPQVIRDFIQGGLLYEDTLHHNCVFVGKDGDGKPRFASKRGTYDLDGPGFKGDVQVIGAALAGKSGLAISIFADEHAVVVQGVLVQQSGLDEGNGVSPLASGVSPPGAPVLDADAVHLLGGVVAAQPLYPVAQVGQQVGQVCPLGDVHLVLGKTIGCVLG